MKSIVLAFVLLCIAMLPVQAAERVGAIRIDGAERLEESTILSYINFKQGDELTDQKIDESLKALFASGLLTDAAIKREGRDVVVAIVENPIINRIVFEGQDRLKEEDLLAEIQLKPRQVFTRGKVQNDVERLLQLYRRNGRFAATIDPKIIRLEQNRIDLVFEVNEGKTTGVTKLAFVGNKHFSADALREEIITRETRWYNALSTNDIYDPDRLAADKEKLRRFYQQNGFADFTIISVHAEMAPEKDGFYITYTLDEGPRYAFQDISIASELKGLDTAPLNELLTMEKGDVYDSRKVDKTIDQLTTAANRSNFPFAEVNPQIRKNPETKTVDMVFAMQEGPKVYVEQINIAGNVRTQDRVVRREFRLAEGDALNKDRLKVSEQKIKDLGFFDATEVKISQGTMPDRAIVDVKVKEQSTGELSIGGGYSTSDGLLGDFSIRERNFLGRGQDLKLSAMLSQRRQNYDLAFTEPYFLDRNLSAGIDLFNTRSSNNIDQTYVQEQAGIGLRLAYPLSDHWRQRLGYRFSNDSITDVESTASRYIREQEGKRISSMVSQELSYDTRNSRIEPTEGHVLSWGVDLAGVGGDVKFVRNKLTASKYFELAEEYVLNVMGEVAAVSGWDDQDVRINNRFFLGAETLRGFRQAGIGPRDISTGDALGGKQYARSTAELSLPLGLPQDLGIKGYVFSDAGTLIESGVSGPTVKDEQNLRLSAGAGLSWRSPFGPIRVDFAEPILNESYDEKQFFRFSFGTRF